jgi:hypothetical protein
MRLATSNDCRRGYRRKLTGEIPKRSCGPFGKRRSGDEHGESAGRSQRATQGSLAGQGYLAKSGTPKFYLDVKILDLDRPMRGMTLHATADVAYEVANRGGVERYHIVTTGSATFSDSPIAIDRIRIANERAMHENIEQFLRALR